MKNKTTSIKSELNDLALTWIQEKDWSVLEKARKIIEAYEFMTYRKTLNDFGFSYFAGINSSSKIVKGKKESIDTLILYLAASKNAGIDLCKFACSGCRQACLVQAGRVRMEKHVALPRIQISRTVKTWLTVWNRPVAEKLIQAEIVKGSNKAKKNGFGFAVRLNGTSDIAFSNIIESNPLIQFYDYTKDPTRKDLSNYHLTYSFADKSKSRIEWYKAALSKGQNLAIPVIATDFEKVLSEPNTFNADLTDLRFKDPIKSGFAILKAKETENTLQGVEAGFILSHKGFLDLVKSVSN